ncbi:SRPBCC family protein [Kribbella deserti]|uniref:SRPBCC family protein n=1 Tax=Kribbella deserti TaxID=1926257 RepID=A0ABV6QX66_9ACTN
MHTNPLSRAVTRSISIQAAPEAVFGFVADPNTLPLWAPGAAKSVRPDGDQWVLHSGEGETRVIVRASEELGTVDLLMAEDPSRGVFTRVLPNGGGSEYQFTLFFPDGTPEDAVATQVAVIDDELEAVRDHCEATRES